MLVLRQEIESVDPFWIFLPLHSDTRNVLLVGYKIIVDKKYYF